MSIKVEIVDIWGFKHAVRAMRNPLDSWDKSDSDYKVVYTDPYSLEETRDFVIGKNDLNLMKRLFKSGTEHRTYARMIQCSMDIVAPLYWWKEMDRYTVGKSQVSCSTMHKIAAKEFELDDFSHEHLINPYGLLADIVTDLNSWRRDYLKTKDKQYWWQLIQLLPSSYNQRRTICMSYETVFKIIKERKGHKLDEWNIFVDTLENLPYVKEIMNIEE